ncbi:MAG: penicillin acylase family protein [Bryobacterales bacterium]|nr:penicillin acylase family protein [Bryobacterales bacterium]
MLARRLLLVMNVLLAGAILIAVLAVYWWGVRPLPQRSGRMHAAIGSPGKIVYGPRGVPRITAGSEEDLAFLQGFATAQERFWQMDMLRRLTAGELAEIVGPAALESDREMRVLRMRRMSEEAVRAMTAGDLRLLAAYARGVNHYLEQNRGKLPLEFAVIGYEPRHWRVADSVLIGLQMLHVLTSGWQNEARRHEMLQEGDPVLVDFLFPVRTGPDVAPGSNAWAVSGSRTASGRAAMANDMHLQHALPNLWYVAELETSDGLHAAGVTLPGLPGVIVGHNEQIAWGITNLHFDVQDLVQEPFDPRTGIHGAAGARRQAQAEREIILVKGQKPVELTVWVTGYGPIVGTSGTEAWSLRWAAAQPGSFQFPFFELNRARNWEEFRSALSRLTGPASNFVYADAGGNIGYQAAGRLPVRQGCDGTLPAPPDCQWSGFIPFEDLPSSLNPESGLIVSANQNPFPEDYKYPVNGFFTAHFRATQIRQRLGARTGWTPDEMVALQKDVYSAFGHLLARSIVAACERQNSRDLEEAVNLLRAWDGQMEQDRPQAVLVALAERHLLKAVTDKAAPGKGLLYRSYMSSAVLEKLLRERPEGWFKDFDGLLVTVLRDAIEEGARIEGATLSRWRYGRFLPYALQHPVGGRLPLVGTYFNIGPLPGSGSSTTIKQFSRQMGPSMRFVAEPGNWEATRLNLPVGQSGHVLSRHYKDQWQAHYQGTSFPLPFGGKETAGGLEVIPERD